MGSGRNEESAFGGYEALGRRGGRCGGGILLPSAATRLNLGVGPPQLGFP